jgi:3-deoxy-manno-octulosonate cytidylyltransferase (CMP-KDO synthetase)
MESSRLPGKILADIHGHPMLWHVYHRIKQCSLPSDTLVVTDSEEIAQRVNDWGGQAVMSSPECSCGTERIASIADQLDGDIVVNVQGDEPLIAPDLVDELIRHCRASDADMVTPVVKINSTETLESDSTVKVVLRSDGTALYFSRSPVPYVRDVARENWMNYANFWLHVGTYAFRREVLLEYVTWPEGPLERLEKLEQLRFLEAGKKILTFQTPHQSIAVDTPDDLEKVRKMMAEMGNGSSGPEAIPLDY